MFRLLYLKLDNHPQLQQVELNFVETQVPSNNSTPFSTVIIGPNGSGKSFLLRAIVEILRFFSAGEIDDASKHRLNYGFHIRYEMDEHIYEIVTRRLIVVEKKGPRRNYLAFRDRPFDKVFFVSKKILPEESLPEYQIKFEEVKFPIKLLASASFINDRFPFKDSHSNEFYQYLGIRRTASATSTGTFTRRTINYLFAAARNRDFTSRMGDMFAFMEFAPQLVINYQTRYHSLFFSSKLTVGVLEQFYERWWELEGVNRKKTNPPWGQWYYLQLKIQRPMRLTEIADGLNRIVEQRRLLHRKPNSRSQHMVLNFLSETYEPELYTIIQDLDKLSIIVLDEICVFKRGMQIPLAQISSGENQLILGLLGIFATIRSSSLILIDEPELSLHPNWQLQYISLLKTMFAAYSDYHFLISTHSHFLVADLEHKSSSIITLQKTDKETTATLLNGVDVFGWSAEEILFTIFKVRTVRNYYFEADLTDLLGLMSENSKEKATLQQKVDALKGFSLSPNDPLNSVITEAQAYINAL